MENIKSWKDIHWVTVEYRVFRLQLRIFKAAKNREFEKMYKLQKLLTNSYYSKYLAVRKVTQDTKGKRIAGVDKIIIKKPKQKFELAKRITLDGISSPIRRTYIPKLDSNLRSLGIPTIEDRAKQMLAYMALCPQWEAQFEANSFGFRPGRSVQDAIQAIWSGLKVEKWVLDVYISKCFDTINHQYLLDKCNTYPEMRKQIYSWLKAGILDGNEFAFPEISTPQGGIISSLLVNIALHGMKEHCDKFINSLGGYRSNNIQALTFVRYADDFVLMHKDKKILLGVKEAVKEFLKSIGLKLSSTKTRLVHTRRHSENYPPGFDFLGFHIIHRNKLNKMGLVFNKKKSKRQVDFVRLITPSEKSIKSQKSKIRKIIQNYRGVSQERLIQILNPIIRGWALSKRSQISSKVFQDLDSYLYMHLWKWARKRHPKMSKIKLKEKYWHHINNSKYKFAVKKKKKDEIVYIRLQYHSKIPIIRHIKIKDDASPFDGNFIYWEKRSGKNSLISAKKARLIRSQKGRCGICGNIVFIDDKI